MSEMKGVKTPHGLQYLLSENVYDEVVEADNGTNTVWNKVNGVIESRETLPELVGFIVFTVLAILHFEPWKVCIIALASCLISYCIRSVVFLYKIPLVTILTILLGFIPRFLLDKIAILAIAIFVLHNWLTGAVYIVVVAVISIILNRSYQKSIPFNDKVASEIARIHK